MSDSEAEDYPSLIHNRAGQDQNENESYFEEPKQTANVIKYQLASLKKYSHKPKRNPSQTEMIKTQTTKIDSIATFKRESFTPLFQSQEMTQTMRSNAINSFCFTSEPRGGIISFQGQQGASDDKLEKVVFIQRQWRKINGKTSNQLTYPGGIVYLPKDKSRFRSYSEEYNVCLEAKEDMEPLRIGRLAPTYITKDFSTNYEEYAEKFVSTQFKLKSAPKIAKAKSSNAKNSLSQEWMNEAIPSEEVRFTIDKRQRMHSIERLSPLRIIGRNQMTYSIGCNTANWSDLNRLRNEVGFIIQKQQQQLDVASFDLSISASLLPWMNKMAIERKSNSSFQLLTTKAGWSSLCSVNSDIEAYRYSPPLKPIAICNRSGLSIKPLKGFSLTKLHQDRDCVLPSIEFMGKTLSKKRNLYHDNAFDIISTIRKWSTKPVISTPRQLLFYKAYNPPTIWNKVNKTFSSHLTLRKSKKSWTETAIKAQSHLLSIGPFFPRRVWNLLNKRITFQGLFIDKTDRPRDVFFSLSSQNSVDYEISVGHSQKDIIHTLSKRDIMYLWNKLNKIERIAMRNEVVASKAASGFGEIVIIGCEDIKAEGFKKEKRTESFRKLNSQSQQYTFREDQVMNSDEDDDELDRIIAICRGEQFTIAKKKKVSLVTKRMMLIESIDMPEYLSKPKKVKAQKPAQAKWNKSNRIDAEGIIDIFVPGEPCGLSGSQISLNTQTRREWEVERMWDRDIVLISSHKAFSVEKHLIEAKGFSFIGMDKQMAELSQSCENFTIGRMTKEVNRRLLPLQLCAFSFDLAMNSRFCKKAYAIVESSAMTIANCTLRKSKEELCIEGHSFESFGQVKVYKGDIIKLDEFLIEGINRNNLNALNEKEKEFSIGSINQSVVAVTDSLEDLLKQKWNRENTVSSNDLELLHSKQHHKANTYSIACDILFSFNPIKKPSTSQTKWESRILPIQAQFYKVIAPKNKWLHNTEITYQHIQMVIHSNYSSHPQPPQKASQSLSLRDPLIISNEFFELLTPRFSKRDRSPKSQTDEPPSSHFSTQPNLQQQPYSKPQKKLIQRESDVLFSSNAKPSEIFISSISQYKSNGKKQVKITKKPIPPSDLSNGI